ncbi:hypothetical protein AVEN_266109-1 [Araneus ventricosus]|uniref:Uncharacterized protein n=1 Tax=Araneus ventricosus TaxID=182803 RepID=A0A4Y2KYB4_ARAVE|nr:hypothetical protein AVEN_266109-1 [Araneus ventricosus]
MYKTWFISLVGFISIQGLFCQVHIKCERDKHTYCHLLAPRIEWGTKFPPNEDEMKELCPTAKGYFECLADYKQICPVPSFDPTDETVVATLQIIREICNETSSLHRGKEAPS